MMKIVEQQGGLPRAMLWIDALDPGPSGRPMLLFHGHDAAINAALGADPEAVHLRHHVEQGSIMGQVAVERHTTIAPDHAMMPLVRQVIQALDQLNRDQLAALVQKEPLPVWGRMLAYAFYLDRCTPAEAEARNAWLARIDVSEAWSVLNDRN